VVSREDLLASVWRGRNVSESTLASRINAARRAVGDTGEQQRLIRTVHGRGFRFVGTIREAEERAASVGCLAVAPSAHAQFNVPDRSPDLLTAAPSHHAAAGAHRSRSCPFTRVHKLPSASRTV